MIYRLLKRAKQQNQLNSNFTAVQYSCKAFSYKQLIFRYLARKKGLSELYPLI
jgi:hypothetical protein